MNTLFFSGDKSLTHRLYMMQLLGLFIEDMENLSTCNDCETTRIAVEQVRNWDARLSPPLVLDCHNSGTTMRLLAGLLAGLNIPCTLIGSDQLLKRPMGRVVEPLRKLGAEVHLSDSLMPAGSGIQVKKQRGSKRERQRIILQIPSAQIKSAILLYARARGINIEVAEETPTRDHTENLLCNGNQKSEVSDQSMTVPGDISSASFLILASLLSQDKKIVCKDVLLNPRRTGFIRALKQMGAKIQLTKKRQFYGEIAGDIKVLPSMLDEINVQDSIADMIDEMPLLVLAATQARGTTIIKNAQELRVKETDRIQTTAMELNKMGANVDVSTDGFVIHGPTPLTGCEVKSHGDHRIAMMLKIASTIAAGETTIQGLECYKDSCPEFLELLRQFG